MGVTGRGEYAHLQNTRIFLFFPGNLAISTATRTAGITPMSFLIRGKVRQGI